MRWVLPVLSGLLLHSAAAAQMGPGGGGMGGQNGPGGPGGLGGPSGAGRAGRPPGGARGPKPLKRERFDKVVTAMFKSADTNQDGTVTPDELRAVIDGRREAAIHARFARIDRNRDGRIDEAEFSGWQRSMGSGALSEAAALGGDGALVPEVIAPALGDGPDDGVLARLVEPFGATVIAAADVNYDAGVTLHELLAYERKRFDAADADHDGELTPDETRDLDQPEGRRVPGDGFGGRGRPPGAPDADDRGR